MKNIYNKWNKTHVYIYVIADSFSHYSNEQATMQGEVYNLQKSEGMLITSEF